MTKIALKVEVKRHDKPMENQPLYVESEEQMAISHHLLQALLATRGEPGIPLEEVGRIIRAVFDRAEVECIIRTLKTNGNNGKTPLISG